jgi:hypothetical protein
LIHKDLGTDFVTIIIWLFLKLNLKHGVTPVLHVQQLPMKQLKNNLLALSNRFILNRTHQHRQIIGLSQASTIGILYHIEQEENYNDLSAFIKILKAEGKKVSVLTYSEHSMNLANSLKYSSFTRESISMTGKIKDQDVETFTSTPFDLLFCIETQPLAVFESILIRSKAKCRAGRHFENKENLFELMVSPTEDTKLTDQLLHYTRLIN